MREDRLINSVVKRAINTTLNGDIELSKYDTEYWRYSDGKPWDWTEDLGDLPVFIDLFLYARKAKVDKFRMHHVIRLDNKESEEESIDLYISEDQDEIHVSYDKRGKNIPVVAFKLQEDITDTSKKNVSVIKINKYGFPEYYSGHQIPATTKIMDTIGFNDFIWWKHIKYGRKIRDFLFDLLWRADLEKYGENLVSHLIHKEEDKEIMECLRDPENWAIREIKPHYSMENFDTKELYLNGKAPYSVFNFSGIFYVPKEMNEQEFCEALQKSVNSRKWKINGNAFQLLLNKEDPESEEETAKVDPAEAETSKEEVVK